MLNFNRGSDRPPDLADPRNAGKPALRPAAVYEPPGSVPSPSPVSSTVRARSGSGAPHRDGHLGRPSRARTRARRRPRTSRHGARDRQRRPRRRQHRSSGVEISGLRSLLSRGMSRHRHSKEMQIAQPGTLKGKAEIDVAEVHGEFTGEITARTRPSSMELAEFGNDSAMAASIVADGGIDQRRHEVDRRRVALRPRATPPRGITQGRHSAASARTAGAEFGSYSGVCRSMPVARARHADAGPATRAVQFALNVTRRTFLSYSASVAIVISLPSAANTRPPLPRQTLRSYWHGPISGCLRHMASTFGAYSMAVWTVALPVPVTHT